MPSACLTAVSHSFSPVCLFLSQPVCLCQSVSKPASQSVSLFQAVNALMSPICLCTKITGLPTRLLPRPPSPKRRTPRNTPSPLRDLRRSPSPTELLKHMTMQPPLSDRRSPSPAQVVPQLNRPPSPLEVFHKYNSIGVWSCSLSAKRASDVNLDFAGKNVRGLGERVVVFRFFEKLRYSNERSTKFEGIYQEYKYYSRKMAKWQLFFCIDWVNRPQNYKGLWNFATFARLSFG